MKQVLMTVIVVAGVLTLLAGCKKETTIPAQVAGGTTKKTAGLSGPFFLEEWLKASSIPGVARTVGVGFTIGSKGYIGGGELDNSYWGEEFFQDFYEYDPSANTWTSKANIPVPVYGAATFVIGTQAYVCTGANSNGQMRTVYRYDQASDTWARMADFPGAPRTGAVGINIGNEGYVGTGGSNALSYLSDWWRYDPSSDQWYPEASFPGGARTYASGFSIGNAGYITCGIGSSGVTNDLWLYWPPYNEWFQYTDLPAAARYAATGFNYGPYGAITCGVSSTSTSLNDFWYYDPNNLTWTQDINFGGGPRSGAVGFDIGGTPYVGTGFLTGSNYTFYSDLWYEALVEF